MSLPGAKNGATGPDNRARKSMFRSLHTFYWLDRFSQLSPRLAITYKQGRLEIRAWGRQAAGASGSPAFMRN